MFYLDPFFIPLTIFNFPTGCINSVRSSTSKPNKISLDPDDEVVTALKRSSLKEGCDDDEENRPQVTREKNKIKSLQTSIHKNLIKLFHKLKSAKPGSVMPDRKEFTNFAEPANQNGKSGNAVSTGIPLSKVRDGIKNISQFQDMNNTSTLKALDKLVGAVLPNMSSLQNNSNPQRADDADGGSGSGTEPNELQKNKSDPYAAIAAGPDHPRLPPDLKITPGGGSDGETPPVVPVGMSDDSKTGGRADEGHGPTPEGNHKYLSSFDFTFTLSRRLCLCVLSLHFYPYHRNFSCRCDATQSAFEVDSCLLDAVPFKDIP